MSEEILLRDRIEIERRRDDDKRLDRINSVEKSVDIIKTRFDGFLAEFKDRAIDDDDLKKLKEEIMGAVQEQLGHICDHVDTKTDSQSETILGKVEQMFHKFEAKAAAERLAQSQALLQANNEARREIIRYGIGFALSVIGTVIAALIIFWMIGRA